MSTPVSLSNNFNVNVAKPIDSRFNVPSATIRKLLAVTNAYAGLIVYQIDTSELYVLEDPANPSLDASWKKIEAGDGGDPTGSNTEIQFNDNGNFGASPRLTFGKTDGLLRISGSFEITGSDISDSFIIKSGSNFNAFKVNNEGVSVLGDFQYTPTAQDGGIMYSSSNLYVGS
tara:strand:+ start:3316 stop:3834 length:519 start_codon:yes stop_codon:yes gene_type:complete